MKALTYTVKKGAFCLLIALIGWGAAQAQSRGKDKENDKTTVVENLINSHNFVFKAQSVTPLGGALRQLTTDYDLRVSNDSIIAYLPYFGRAYVAPMDPTDGGIQFTSKDFGYTVTNKRKGGWSILITPKDTKDVRQLTLDVSEKGYASLEVTSENRQFIGYNGYITERGKR